MIQILIGARRYNANAFGKEDISKPRENDDEEPPKVDRETFCKAHKIF
ncbi:2532_t:CDS:2 [Entrophospora sp. SA101]|nr:2532_t:CDS:2 [Entrophospora sp. SA101]CAJ0840016.1 17765_t:CDS:2 [Entrophospora sp. SA101]